MATDMKFTRVLRAAFVDLCGDTSNPRQVVDETFSSGGITQDELEIIDFSASGEDTEKMRQLILWLLREDGCRARVFFLAALQKYETKLHATFKHVYDLVGGEMGQAQVKEEWNRAYHRKRKHDEDYDADTFSYKLPKTEENHVVRNQFLLSARQGDIIRVERAGTYYHCPKRRCPNSKLSAWTCERCAWVYDASSAALGMYAHLVVRETGGQRVITHRVFRPEIDEIYRQITGDDDLVRRVCDGEPLDRVLSYICPASIVFKESRGNVTIMNVTQQ